MGDGGGITVRGTGQVTREPDLARVTLGVDVTEAGAGAAQSAASERMRAVVAALGEAGVAGRDLATARISLAASWDYSGATPRMTGYTASQALAVRVRDLDALGRLIDLAVTAGATTVTDVSLEVSDPGAALAEARELAVADARAKATSLARAAGVSLGRAVALTEGPRGEPGVPMFKMAHADMAAAPPVEAGEAALAVEVEVTFAILG